MNTFLRLLTIGIVCSAVACGDNDPKLTITLFAAAPDTIDMGGSTLLLFTVNPPDANMTITGMGDVTGHTQMVVNPTATTTYHLTATKGQFIADNSITVTVKQRGLFYTAPTSGRVRLVANTEQSTPQVIQLDLVANERLEVSSFFGGGPGSFAAGMNLPIDTTRVAPDTTLFTAGNALIVGPTTATPILPVAIGRLGADHVLYTAVSRKRVAGTVFKQGTEVQAGQVFYSIRLALLPGATVGPVFDGAQPSPLFRAAVRDQYGDDFVRQSDFGIGELEVH